MKARQQNNIKKHPHLESTFAASAKKPVGCRVARVTGLIPPIQNQLCCPKGRKRGMDERRLLTSCLILKVDGSSQNMAVAFEGDED